MNTWKKAVAITVVGVVLPVLALSQERTPQPDGDSLEVVRDVVTTGIVNREPVDDTSGFPPSMEALYYFTEVRGAGTPTQITHIWYYQDRQMAEVPLSVDGPRWRTWSSKRILENWVGSWRVEAVDADGNVLSSQSFDIN
jgi:hypothetical protein